MELIGKNEIKGAIELLLDFVGERYARFSQDVYLISARYHQIEKEKIRNIINRQDYELEISSIRASLLEIINSMEGLGEENFKKKRSADEIKDEIEKLERRFFKCRKTNSNIKSNQTRLREKNEIAREFGQIFIDYPELIEGFYATKEEGVISGISNRYKRVPDNSGIDFFESISTNDLGNFTKCCIVNALAEILYSGQLQMGDETRINKILDDLYPNSFQTVRISITRVSAEVEYFLNYQVNQ
jgi:hypothetical protein